MNNFGLVVKWNQLFERTQIEPRGVIYCGAHVGEDIAPFLTVGFSSVLAIEPNVTAFDELQKYASGHVKCVNVAVGDHDGREKYYAIKGVPTLNSTHAPSMEYWEKLAGMKLPQKALVDELEVACETLDTLVGRYPADYNVLYMNIQGGELAALRGARALLPKLDVVIAEVNFVPRYEDMPVFPEIERFMSEAGYVSALVSRHPLQAFQHGEAYFINTKSPSLVESTERLRKRFQKDLAEILTQGSPPKG
jgi:FkbM family methyltransferase